MPCVSTAFAAVALPLPCVLHCLHSHDTASARVVFALPTTQHLHCLCCHDNSFSHGHQAKVAAVPAASADEGAVRRILQRYMDGTYEGGACPGRHSRDERDDTRLRLPAGKRCICHDGCRWPQIKGKLDGEGRRRREMPPTYVHLRLPSLSRRSRGVLRATHASRHHACNFFHHLSLCCSASPLPGCLTSPPASCPSLLLPLFPSYFAPFPALMQTCTHNGTPWTDNFVGKLRWQLAR